MIKRFDDAPEYVNNAKVRKVVEESIEGDMFVEYSINFDCWIMYVDRYISDDADYQILKIFFSIQDLVEWLEKEGR